MEVEAETKMLKRSFCGSKNVVLIFLMFYKVVEQNKNYKFVEHHKVEKPLLGPEKVSDKTLPDLTGVTHNCSHWVLS